MAWRRRNPLAAAIRALQDELAGGPRAELPAELELLGGLVHTREERAKTKEEPERELLSALPDAAALIGKDGRVRVANSAFDALAPRGRATGVSPVEITRSAELGEAVHRALEGTGRRLEFDVAATRRVWLAHLRPLLRGEVLLLMRDVTDAKRAEAMRRDFVANASHELRTPVTAIRGAADTLLGGALADPESARRFVDMIARHAERLARLTQDLLDLSRLESGLWTMQIVHVEIAPLAESVFDLHAERAADKGVRLVRDVPGGTAARADPRALEQVLVNLVDNAIKYTPAQGNVTVAAARAKGLALAAEVPPGLVARADARALAQVLVNLVDNAVKYTAAGAVTIRAAAEGGAAIVSVVDTGPGIERHHLPRLFERFYRADAGRSREEGGTGLGLAIVKHLVQAQGGTVGVESGAGGSRFWVKLPSSADPGPDAG